MASDSTLYRTFRPIGPEVLDRLWEAMAEVRAGVWRRAAATTGTATVVLDIDGSLQEVHSENKVDAAANYKGGYGFHPMYCFADAGLVPRAVQVLTDSALAAAIGAFVLLDHGHPWLSGLTGRWPQPPARLGWPSSPDWPCGLSSVASRRATSDSPVRMPACSFRSWACSGSASTSGGASATP